jgi:hypothetical protein
MSEGGYGIRCVIDRVVEVAQASILVHGGRKNGARRAAAAGVLHTVLTCFKRLTRISGCPAAVEVLPPPAAKDIAIKRVTRSVAHEVLTQLRILISREARVCLQSNSEEDGEP